MSAPVLLAVVGDELYVEDSAGPLKIPRPPLREALAAVVA